MTTATEISIGEAARLSGLSEDTLRWYERIGLTPHVDRSPSGHRRYTERDLLWLEFIGRMRSTGMPIETLQRYAELTRHGDETAAERMAMLEEHASALEARIAELQRAREILDKKIAQFGTLCAPRTTT